MKIDRLIGITIYLLNRSVVTAKELADRFGVSVRTIVLDIVRGKMFLHDIEA